ncbi:hypothetical protein [Pedobacter sp. GR22-6]|uniref:hypothetical protein n=1 Tax=Pedobacter sp. GR22-6 TaxID=3127957 RepID=UPI00307DF5F3
MRWLLVFLVIFGFCSAGFSQTNVQLLHQLVDESKSEHSRQTEARNRQTVASANEEVNKGQMGRLKSKYRELQFRFRALGLAIDAAQIGLQAAPIVSEIVSQQRQILDLAADDPLLIALAYDVEADLAGQAHGLLNYLYGLAISVGDLNQMKASDRKILFGHVLVELRRIAGTSRGLSASLLGASRKKSLSGLNPFAGFVQEDKRLVEEIMRNFDSLKH